MTAHGPQAREGQVVLMKYGLTATQLPSSHRRHKQILAHLRTKTVRAMRSKQVVQRHQVVPQQAAVRSAEDTTTNSKRQRPRAWTTSGSSAPIAKPARSPISPTNTGLGAASRSRALHHRAKGVEKKYSPSALQWHAKQHLISLFRVKHL